MHPQISINTLCLAPDALNQQIEAVARLGARAISFEVADAQTLGIGVSRQSLRDTGLALAALTHRSFAFASKAEAAAGRERLMQTLADAAQIGAQSVLMTTGGRGGLAWPEAAARFAEAVAPCAELAHSAGIRLGIEPTSHLYADVSIALRLADTAKLAQIAGIDVAIDLFACWFDSDIDVAIANAGSRIALVQVSDYVLGDRGLPCRAVPGDGAVPLGKLLPQISATGFSGHFDLEIIGPRLAAEGIEAGLRRAGEHVGLILEAG